MDDTHKWQGLDISNVCWGCASALGTQQKKWKLHIWKQGRSQLQQLPREVVRWPGEAESGPGERWKKVGEAVIENERDLLQYRDEIPHLTV